MRYFTSALCTAVGVGLLAACAGNLSGQSGSVPSLTSPSRVAQANNRVPISLVAAWMRPTGIQRLHLGTAFPDKKKKSAGGLYGSEFYSSPTSDAEGLINAYRPLVTEVGADIVSIQVMCADPMGAIKRIGKEVLPELRKLAG